MKLIDRLLLQARYILTENNFNYDTNEDGFIDALGLDPEAYRVEYPNGEHGYDILKALCEIAPGLWDDEKTEKESKCSGKDE